MSFGGEQARSFLGALEGRTTAFRLRDRVSNLRFAEAVLPLLASDGKGCELLDLDAFYSSNLGTVAAGVSPQGMESLEITIPEPGSDIELAVAGLFQEGGGKTLIIDSVNSLYQLLSTPDPKSSSRKFAFLISALSVWARDNRTAVVASIYERRAVSRGKMSRSLVDLFDSSVSVSNEKRGISLKWERGGAGRGVTLFLPLQVGEE